MRLMNKNAHVAKSLGHENVTEHRVVRRLRQHHQRLACHVLVGQHILAQTQRLSPSTTCSEHSHFALSLNDLANSLSVNKEIRYLFVVPEFVTTFGQELKVVGSCMELGNWDASKAPKMSWSPGHRWQLDIALPRANFEFKVVMVQGSHMRWEQGVNRVVQTDADGKGGGDPVEIIVRVKCLFDKTDKTSLALLLPTEKVQEASDIAEATFEMLEMRRRKLQKEVHNGGEVSVSYKRVELEAMREALAGQSTSINQLCHILHSSAETLDSDEGVEEYLPLDIGRVPVMPSYTSVGSNRPSSGSSKTTSVPALAKLAADSFLPPEKSSTPDLLLSQYIQDNEPQESTSWERVHGSEHDHRIGPSDTAHAQLRELTSLMAEAKVAWDHSQHSTGANSGHNGYRTEDMNHLNALQHRDMENTRVWGPSSHPSGHRISREPPESSTMIDNTSSAAHWASYEEDGLMHDPRPEPSPVPSPVEGLEREITDADFHRAKAAAARVLAMRAAAISAAKAGNTSPYGSSRVSQSLAPTDATTSSLHSHHATDTKSNQAHSPLAGSPPTNLTSARQPVQFPSTSTRESVSYHAVQPHPGEQAHARLFNFESPPHAYGIEQSVESGAWAPDLSAYAAAAAAALPEGPAATVPTQSFSRGNVSSEEKKSFSTTEEPAEKGFERFPDAGASWAPDFSAFVAAAESNLAGKEMSENSYSATSTHYSSVKTASPSEVEKVSVENLSSSSAWAPDFSTYGGAAWNLKMVESSPPSLSIPADTPSILSHKTETKVPRLALTAFVAQPTEEAEPVPNKQTETSQVWPEGSAAWAPDFSAYESVADSEKQTVDWQHPAVDSYAAAAAQRESKRIPEAFDSESFSLNAVAEVQNVEAHEFTLGNETEKGWSPDFSAYVAAIDSSTPVSVLPDQTPSYMGAQVVTGASSVWVPELTSFAAASAYLKFLEKSIASRPNIQPNVQELVSAQSSTHFSISDGWHYQPSFSTSASHLRSLGHSQEPLTSMMSRSSSSASASTLRQRILSDHEAIQAAAAEAGRSDSVSAPDYYNANAVFKTPGVGASNLNSNESSSNKADLSTATDNGHSAEIRKILVTAV